MDAVWIDVPVAFLEERRLLGHDKRDELWEGVLHMVPPGSYVHGRRASDLFLALRAIAERRGLVANPDGFGLFAPEIDPVSYRIPDVSIVRPDQISERGLEGAELAVEVLSPNDESRKKLAFYARTGVREVWILDPRTCALEIYSLVSGGFVLVANDRSPLLGITLEVVAGPKLRLRDGCDVTDV